MFMQARGEAGGLDTPAPVTRSPLHTRYAVIREASLALCDGLSADDCQLQSMPEASPVKWHLAHTTWFFETFVLAQVPRYAPFRAEFRELFNSYYHGVGPQHPRAERGLLSRPTFDEVAAYREHVDAAIVEIADARARPDLDDVIELGLQHEQQHQELILTDLKHALSRNPLQPTYRVRPAAAPAPVTPPGPSRWLERPGGLVEVGADTSGFAFDNERPRHRVWLEPHALASRTVANAEYLEFIRDGGYTTPTLWLDDGWAASQAGGWTRPLYWTDDWAQVFTLHGLQPLEPDEPVCHVSYYEADAFARWAGARLPREEEWEVAAAAWAVDGTFVDTGVLHPRHSDPDVPGFFGNVWEWTLSPYMAYPGYRPVGGALGEYNGKFMCNQLVLRGGSCLSPREHLRASYRNFFAPGARWQMSGIRLARDAS